MTGLVRKALLLTALGLMVAGSAFALVPNRANSTFPPGVAVVGSNDIAGTTVDPAGEFSVTVRDINNTLVNGATVTVDFSGCTTDIRLSSQTFPGVTQAGCVVSATTNVLGVATFRIRGGALNPGNGPGAGFGCGLLKAEGVFFNNLTVAAFDQTGNLNGVTGGDLSAWTADFFAVPQPAVGRSDYNFSGTITGGDLSLWAADFFSPLSDQNGGIAAGCP